MRDQIKASAIQFSSCVAIDLRGYNESERPLSSDAYTIDALAQDVAEVIEHFGGRVFLVGHDFGALISWTVARERPELVERLVILNVPEPRALQKRFDHDLRQRAASWFVVVDDKADCN